MTTNMFGDTVPEPLAILEDAITRYTPSLFYAAVSGGRDSTALLHVVKDHPRFGGALHVNTGIGLEETRQFVRDLCSDWNVRLYEYKAEEYLGRGDEPKPIIYEALVLKYGGFPGPQLHSQFYGDIKGKPFAQFIRERKREGVARPMLVTGIRKQESQRRIAIARAHQVVKNVAWVCPLFHWSTFDRDRYIEQYDLPISRASLLLNISGECLCGAFGSPHELQLLRDHYPVEAARIDALAEQCRACGIWDKWGMKKPTDKYKISDVQGSFLPFCVGCVARHEPREDEIEYDEEEIDDLSIDVASAAHPRRSAARAKRGEGTCEGRQCSAVPPLLMSEVVRPLL